MDLAEGHIIALQALESEDTFKKSASAKASEFGGSGGNFKAYNLGKGKGMSVFKWGLILASVHSVGSRWSW